MNAIVRSDEATGSRRGIGVVRVVRADVGLLLGELLVQRLPSTCLGCRRPVAQVLRFPIRRALSRLIGLVGVVTGVSLHGVEVVGVTYRVPGLVHTVAEQVAVGHGFSLSPRTSQRAPKMLTVRSGRYPFRTSR